MARTDSAPSDPVVAQESQQPPAAEQNIAGHAVASANSETSPSEEAPAASAEGRIKLAIVPWGEVYVDGRKAGVSPPLTELRLSAGTHRIEIRNSDFKPYRKRVELAGGRSVRIKHKFD